MKAVYHNFDGKLYIRDIPEPVPQSNEVLIKIAYSCICDDEVKVITGGSNYFRTYSSPLDSKLQGIGHEASGIVITSCPAAREIGITEGTEVTIHPNEFCGKCHYCLTGRENLCLQRKSTMRMMREYIAVNYKNVYPLRNRISLREGCLVQPTACVLRAVENAGIGIGQSVLIIGNSFASILMIMLAKQRGAGMVNVIGYEDHFMDMAKAQSADNVFSIQDSSDMIRAMNITDNLGYDVVFETSWTFVNKEIAMGMLSRGGTIVYFSQVNTNTLISFNAFELFWKEATVKSSYGFPYSFERTIDCLKTLNTEILTSDIFTLDNIQTAFDNMSYGNVLKAIIRF